MMTADYKEILYTVDGPVATITMNRPDQMNALTSLTQAEIRHALDQSERNREIVGTVLTGAGRGFCAGVDMNDLSDMSDAGERLEVNNGWNFGANVIDDDGVRFTNTLTKNWVKPWRSPPDGWTRA